MKKISFILLSSLFLSSCGMFGSDASDRADELCECVTNEIDIDGINIANAESRMREIERDKEKQRKLASCMLGVAEEIGEDMKELDKDDKKEYVKDFMKGLIDCECMDAILDNVPFDMIDTFLPTLRQEMDKEFSRNSRRGSNNGRNNYDDYNYDDYDNYDDYNYDYDDYEYPDYGTEDYYYEDDYYEGD